LIVLVAFIGVGGCVSHVVPRKNEVELSGTAEPTPPPIPVARRWTRIDHALPHGLEIYDAAVGDQGFALVGDTHEAPDTWPSAIWFSPDGITWTDVLDASTGAFWNIDYGNGVFVADGGPSPHVWYSKYGQMWSPAVISPSPGIPIRAWAWNIQMTHAGRFFAWTRKPAVIWTSPDGRTWSPLPDQSPFTRPHTEIDWLADGPTGFMFGGLLDRRPEVWMSSDGVTWTRARPRIPMFSSGYRNRYRSAWTRLQPFGIPTGFAWFWNRNRMIVSSDGVTWSPRHVLHGAPIPTRSPAWSGLIDESQPSGYIGTDWATVYTSVDGTHWDEVPDRQGVLTPLIKSVTSEVVGGSRGMLFFERWWAWGDEHPRPSRVWVRLTS